jgi:hypothetical protein
MKTLMKKKNWLGFVAALGLFALVPSVLWSQSGGSGGDQDAFTLNVKRTSGTIHLWVDTYGIEDRITMFCPPRAKSPSKNAIFDWNGSAFPKKIVQNWSGSTEVEIVMNMNNPNPMSSWEWNATIYPKGGRPFTVIRDPTMIVSTPPKVSTTGTIFQAKGGVRSNAGTPKGRPGGGGKVPPRRRGYVTRMVTPTTSSTGNTMVLTPKAATSKRNSKQMPKVLFSGKGSITTHIRRLPTRSVRRIALRGGRPY